MPLLLDHIPKLIHNSGCLMGRAMNVPTAIMLTESHTHTHTHMHSTNTDIITKGSGDANIH